jgi:uncharacterized protein YneF (UPF0154 family)
MRPDKIIYGAVIGFFYIGRKKTSRDLTVFPVVNNALATYAFA